MLSFSASGMKFWSPLLFEFSTSKSKSIGSMPLVRYQAARLMAISVLPTPPLPPWVKTTRIGGSVVLDMVGVLLWVVRARFRPEIRLFFGMILSDRLVPAPAPPGARGLR